MTAWVAGYVSICPHLLYLEAGTDHLAGDRTLVGLLNSLRHGRGCTCGARELSGGTDAGAVIFRLCRRDARVRAWSAIAALLRAVGVERHSWLWSGGGKALRHALGLRAVGRFNRARYPRMRFALGASTKKQIWQAAMTDRASEIRESFSF